MRPSRLATLAAALTLAAVTGCATDTSDTTGGQADAQAPAVPAEFGHVHGMSVNPADGRLYLGTHGGTLVVDGEEITKVGDSSVDLMGFSGAGPDHFYASGHPGPGDELPNPVGLIESRDGGRTWQSLSLAGEADFHTLGAAGDRVYGFHGSLVTSDGGRDWVPAADDVAPAAIAVDPADPDRVVATTEHGPVRSDVAAERFTHLEGAPLLVFVAWPAPDELWGVGPDGGVHLSTDGGDSWESRGDAGEPTALTAAEGGTVVVANASQIVSSTDGGRTFSPVATLTASGH